MSNESPSRAAAEQRLIALRAENYRRTRWAAIHAARQAGMTWAEIGDALGIMATAASRMYRTDAPAE
ncbi:MULTISPECIES: hypothetical protein [unclassified Microbacterium]|uniref:hypothetical protein n=1 Tax=unclassified Microbacterium TaxID=2609290 RepID=UPI0011C48AB6|nr:MULTISPECIES: hypothetical protein [unclassified Microbacterium]MBT2484783.1 hypothetical protein [Microbacterium sp. ISL-108]